MPKWTHVLVHHSASRDNIVFSDAAAFRSHHRAKGWSDIGYHAVAERFNGEVTVIAGRSEAMAGAHCPGMNTKALGICLAGNFSMAPPDAELLQAAAEFVATWLRKHRIPVENVHGHRDHRATECPGKLFDMEAFRALVMGSILEGASDGLG